MMSRDLPSRTVTLVSTDDERQYRVDVVGRGNEQGVRVEQRLYSVTHDGDGAMRVTGEGSRQGTTAWTVAVGDVRWVFVNGRVFELAEARPLARASSGHHGALTAPMPATVRRVLVAVGDTVTRGDALVILEAMKMELPVRANGPGVVTAVHCREGELVQPGLTLIEIGE